MGLAAQPKSDAIRRLYWRDEILQLLFWLEGEGFGDAVDPNVLDRFLGGEGEIAVLHLPRLAAEGLLDAAGEAYRLSERGRDEGARLFAEEQADLSRPAHGQCGEACWCRHAVIEAAACEERRAVLGW